jgi:hypothetical protein
VEAAFDPHLLIDALKLGGIQILIAAVFIYYIRLQSRMASKVNDQHFQVLQGFLETQQAMIGQLARMETNIATNNYCPLMRERGGEGR